MREEKQKLVKEGKIKKEKDESRIYRKDGKWYEGRRGNEAEIDTCYFIPDSWFYTRLKNIAMLISGQDLPSGKYSDIPGGIPYITGASNINKSNIIINRWTNTPTSVATDGDLLLTCKGTIGKTCIVSGFGDMHIARQIMAIRSYSSVDIRYIHAVIMCAVSYLKEDAQSMIPGISRDDVLQILVPIPPFYEQKRIVTKIEELVACTNRLNELMADD